jgi:hypothetical protein
MLAYCGRPGSAGFCDPFPYICGDYARETIAEIRRAAQARPGSPPLWRSLVGTGSYRPFQVRTRPVSTCTKFELG